MFFVPLGKGNSLRVPLRPLWYFFFKAFKNKVFYRACQGPYLRKSKQATRPLHNNAFAFHPRPSAGNFSFHALRSLTVAVRQFFHPSPLFAPTPAKKTTRIHHPNKTQSYLTRSQTKKPHAESQRPQGFYAFSLCLCVRPFTTNVNSPTFAVPRCNATQGAVPKDSPSNKTPRLSHPTLGPPSNQRQKSPPMAVLQRNTR